MTARALAPDAVLHIAQRMRDRDRAEVFALMDWDAGPELVAHQSVGLSQFGGTIHADDGEPVAAIGMMLMWPGAYAAWMYATPRWAECWRAGVRWTRDVLLPQTHAAGGWRLQCHSMLEHTDAHRFLRHIGFVAEGPPVPMGRCREQFIPFAKVLA